MLETGLLSGAVVGKTPKVVTKGSRLYAAACVVMLLDVGDGELRPRVVGGAFVKEEQPGNHLAPSHAVPVLDGSDVVRVVSAASRDDE